MRVIDVSGHRSHSCQTAIEHSLNCSNTLCLACMTLPLPACRDAEGSQPLYWGATADGQLLLGSNLNDMEGCDPTATAFPPGVLLAALCRCCCYLICCCCCSWSHSHQHCCCCCTLCLTTLLLSSSSCCHACAPWPPPVHTHTGTLFASTRHTVAYSPGACGWVIEEGEWPGQLLSFLLEPDGRHWRGVKVCQGALAAAHVQPISPTHCFTCTGESSSGSQEETVSAPPTPLRHIIHAWW